MQLIKNIHIYFIHIVCNIGSVVMTNRNQFIPNCKKYLFDVDGQMIAYFYGTFRPKNKLFDIIKLIRVINTLQMLYYCVTEIFNLL